MTTEEFVKQQGKFYAGFLWSVINGRTWALDPPEAFERPLVSETTEDERYLLPESRVFEKTGSIESRNGTVHHGFPAIKRAREEFLLKVSVRHPGR